MPIDHGMLFRRLQEPEIAESPLNFVLEAFPWGESGTPLAHYAGPRKWQIRVLREVERHLKGNLGRKEPEMLRKAVASGRGIGKSALVSWLILWFMSTRIGGTCIVSANSEAQLKGVTWGELGKWHTLALNNEWFEISATALRPTRWFANEVERQLGISENYYYCQQKLWSEENPDAYAGAHNPLGMLLMFDEASGIPAPIWSVAEGYFTEPVIDRYWFAFSNPRKNEGAFFECFHKKRDFWSHENIDSRTVEGTDKNVYEQIIRQYGEDSDEARVEVKGEFPNTGARQFIDYPLIAGAIERETYEDSGAPLLMGVDVARYGEDRSVIAFRRGRDARSIPWQAFKKIDTQQLAYRVAEAADKYNPSAIFVDGGGVGGGVVDALKAMRFKVIEVQAGGKADDADKYRNKRAEMWGRMKEWLETGCIPGTKELEDDLKSPQYEWHSITGQLQLESKDDMRKRGYSSPDMAEALCQTFAKPVARDDIRTSRRSRTTRMAEGIDYDVFGG